TVADELVLADALDIGEVFQTRGRARRHQAGKQRERNRKCGLPCPRHLAPQEFRTRCSNCELRASARILANTLILRKFGLACGLRSGHGEEAPVAVTADFAGPFTSG